MSLRDLSVEKVWMNGDFVDWDDARIHALSHVANYGTGVFDGCRCYETADGPAVFRPHAHVDRLFDSSKILGMDLEYTKDEFLEVARALVDRNGLDSCYIRFNVSYGYDSLGLDPGDNPINALVAAFPRETFLGEDALETGADVQLSPWRRIHSSQFPTQAKAIGMYVLSSLAKQGAVSNGYDEAIMLDAEGNVAEGTGENLFVVRDGTLYTPGLDLSILPGITRDSIMQIADDLGYEVAERRITTGQLFTADELFFCGTAAEVTPIRSVDDTEIGDGTPGPVTREIQRTFFEVVRGERDGYEEWLDRM